MPVKHGAKLLLLDSDMNVLILRRSDSHPHIPLTADLPGGVIEEGETPVTAVCRETLEETGIVLSEADVEQVARRQHSAFGRDYNLYLFVASVTERPAVTISWEHDKYSWIPLQEVRDLDAGFQPMVDEYRRTTRA